MAGGDQQFEVAVGKWGGFGFWDEGLRNKGAMKKVNRRRSEFGGDLSRSRRREVRRCRMHLQRRTNATMRTISRIKPSVLPPITQTSPNIGVVNVLIIVSFPEARLPLSFDNNLDHGACRCHGVKPLQGVEISGGGFDP